MLVPQPENPAFGADASALESPGTDLPLYAQVARNLREQIRTGALPVGSLLPNETDLAASFKVSRQTVRQAIGQLRQGNLVSARRGVGTRVESRQEGGGYQFSLHTLTDIFQYANDTMYEPVEREFAPAPARLAASLGCRSGRALFRLAGLRRVIGDAKPLCWSDLWVPAGYAHVLKDVAVFRSAIFSLLERKTGESIVDVSQDIDAVAIPERIAGPLQAAAGSPGLKVTRRYFGDQRRFVEASVSIYPADRFSYRIDLRRTRSPTL